MVQQTNPSKVPHVGVSDEFDFRLPEHAKIISTINRVALRHVWRGHFCNDSIHGRGRCQNETPRGCQGRL